MTAIGDETLAHLRARGKCIARVGNTAVFITPDELLGLLDLVDELKAEADKWQRAALTLQADRDALAAKVERVTGEAADMCARLSRAARALDDDKLAEVGEARARLHGKAQGVRLALDYFRGTALDGRAADHA